MLSNRFTFVALGLAGIGAAAWGGYLAGRQGVPEAPATAAVAYESTSGQAVQSPGPAPVQETEAVVGDLPAKPPASADAARPSTNQPRPQAASTPAAPPTRNREQAPEPRSRPPQTTAASERIWPPAGTAPPAPVAASLPAPSPNVLAEERAPEVIRTPEPPAPQFEELVVAADSVIGLQTETPLSSDRARVEDRVEARVIRDVRVGGRVAIPAGTRVLGSVVAVDRGGKLRERARLGIRFHTLALADGTRVPIETDAITRFGDERSNRTAQRVGGGAVAGAILGAIIGGGKGAAIGATTGAAGGAASVMAGDRSEATFPAGAEVTARVVSPVHITVER